MNQLAKSVALLVLCVTTANAQVVSKVNLGKDNEQTTKILKILGENKEGIFYMSAKKNDLYVEKYSAAKLSIVASEKIDIPNVGDVRLELEEMFLTDKDILLFASGYSPSKSAYLTYSFKIDKACNLKGKGTLVFEMPVEKKNRGGSVSFQRSMDHTHILVSSSAYLKKEEKMRFSYILIDREGNVETEQTFDVAEGEGREVVRVEDIDLDRNNDIHVVISRSNYDRKTKETNQEFEVVSYRKSNNYDPSNTKLTLGANQIISSAIISARNDGQIALAGLYIPLKNGRRATGLEGTFYTTINAEGDLGEIIVKEFSDDFKLNFMKEKKVEKGVDIPVSYRMKEAFLSDNDEIVFIAEQYIVDVADNGAKTYIYGPIMVIKVNGEGQIMWEQVINKMQLYVEAKIGLSGSSGGLGVGAWITVTSDKTIFMSYKAWMSGGSLVLLFNDDKDNESKLAGDKRAVLRRVMQGTPFSATVDENGKLKYNMETSLGDEETLLRPRMAHVQDNKLYFVTTKKSVEKVGIAVLQ